MKNASLKLRTYSRYSQEAMALFGKMIRTARIEQAITTTELAGRAGISRGLLQRIEKGDLACAIGSVFEVAAVVGIGLFDDAGKQDAAQLAKHHQRLDDKLTLLPKAVRKPSLSVDDDF